jgi:hypothetical protein
VGDKLTIRVGGVSGNGCEGQPVTTGIVKSVSQHAIFVIDSAAPGNGTTPGTTFSSTDLDAIGQDFDNLVFPTDTSYFGSPSDIDGNGKIIIYYTPEVNKLTPSSSTTGRVGGFFFAGDLFPTTGGNSCAESNESEIFYLLAPDPNGRFSIPITVEQVRQLTRGTIAHEFQHMINAGNRLFRSNATSFEAAWLDEALAHFAEGAVGRVEAGLGDLHSITLQDLQQMDTLVQSAFFIQNLARAKIYLSDPAAAAPVSSEDKVGHDLAARGAAWSFLRYAADWFSHDAPRALTRKLAFGPDTGTANVTRQTGQPLDTLLSHWLLALSVDHNGSNDVPAQFSFRSYAWRPVLTAVNDGSGNGQHYTLPVHVLGAGGSSYSASYPGTSGAFFLASEGTSQSRHITITSDASATGRVYILRVR